MGEAMWYRGWSRRDVLKTSTALAASALFAEPAKAVAPPPTGVTPTLVEAARNEGRLSYYCALELNVAERLARTFEAKYPGIAVRVERSGAERIFQRIAQEQGSGINAVDVANSTDPAHYLDWKAKDWLAPYVPEDVARHFPADHVDPEDSTQPLAAGSKPSATTAIWSSARMRPEATPICSIRSGRARSSRLTPAIAAR